MLKRVGAATIIEDLSRHREVTLYDRGYKLMR